MSQILTISFKQSTKRHTGWWLIASFCILLHVSPCWAKESPQGLRQDQLEGLARDFLSKIGGKLKEYKLKNAAEKNAQGELSLVPDGEVLLLRPKADKFIMDNEIAAIKKDGQIYYALQDLINNLELSIDYNQDKKTGSGWFLREDWLIRMDFITGEVVSRGKTYKVSDKDILEDGGMTYISQSVAQNWMDIKTEPEISLQYLDIRTPVPFPALARHNRNENKVGKNARLRPVLPRLETEQKMLDINLAEIQENVRFQSRPDKPNTVTHQNITTIQGDVLKHSLNATSFWDKTEKLTSVRATLSKEDENPVLLGPLKARSYSLGDTDIAQVPLTGSSTQELGFRVGNSPLRNIDFQSTTVSGDALPGWDVELYRDGILVDRIHISDDSHYEFREVELYAGDNLFEVFFYGPQGEIRSENFNLPVTQEFLAKQDNTYDVSLSFSESQLYTKNKSDDVDANTPHLVARYNKQIGSALTYAGLNAKQENGEAKAYLGAGFTDVVKGFIIDGNAASDEKGATAFELGARKTIDDWRLSLTGNLQDEKFQADGEDSANVMGVRASANKSFKMPFSSYSTLSASAQYGVRADDSIQTSGLLGISNQIGRLNLSSTTSYTKISNLPAGASEDAFINNTLSARMNLGRTFTTAGVSLNVKPEQKVDNYFGQLSYQPSSAISTDLRVEHDPDTKLSEGRLSLNYRHDKFRLTPFISMDTESKLETGVRLTTTLVDDPSKALPTFTGTRVIGRGLLSAFVFHDKNGNNIFDGDDEALPDVVVEAINVSKRSPTNDKGYSLLTDLPENFVTDIHLDQSTLPDPFMIAAFDGVSIFPRAGEMVNLTFPVHVAGEISGMVTLKDAQQNEKPVSGVGMKLIPVNNGAKGVIDSFVATDGFYAFSNVPPGNYLLTIDTKALGRIHGGGAKPVPVQIGYNGTVLDNKNFVLNKDRVQVPLEVKPYEGQDYTQPFFALQTGKSSTRSKLSSLLSGLIEKKTNIDPDQGLTPLTIGDQRDLKVLSGKGWQEHYDRCQLLNDAKIPCKVILFMPNEKSAENSVVAQK